ncbi:hypothetical protein OSJ77_10285 [Phyllobacterium sp. 0TCS1.6C]|uniref:hypothetical protein n=1 Tax=unclassified Phyllobacterium TaxID=2638441 RepID=UPI0022642BB8|nr:MULTISPECIES: hypothetical protein [unclassified Phyllobacterium]MCX8280579.1 hypothetical protein [Phyllobacterium sp. 0TCS1.6C]MCX8294972.1 hypothetical protein [Phyllobacterium sp. 0TCS1.6A]
MTTPTVPQDVYLRHEREWQMLRQALHSKPETEKKPAFDAPAKVNAEKRADLAQ